MTTLKYYKYDRCNMTINNSRMIKFLNIGSSPQAHDTEVETEKARSHADLVIPPLEAAVMQMYGLKINIMYVFG